MRRLFCFVLVLLMVCTMVLPAAASQDVVQPRWTYLSSVSAALQINGLGIASCSGQALVTSSNRIAVYVTLQQYTDSGWVTLRSWSATGKTTTMAGGQYAVARGYTYRVNVTAYVYDGRGNVIETGSASKTCVF